MSASNSGSEANRTISSTHARCFSALPNPVLLLVLFFRRFREVMAFMGNVGSDVLSFMTKEWILDEKPDLVLIEAVINDGDTVLETGKDQSIRRAVEGIVRQVRTSLPKADMVFIYHFLRTDVSMTRANDGFKVVCSTQLNFCISGEPQASNWYPGLGRWLVRRRSDPGIPRSRTQLV